MDQQTVDWVAALAEVEAKIAKLQAFAENIRDMMASAGLSPSPSGGGGGIRPDAFLKLSIPDATKKYLGVARQKKSTQEVMDALEQGGLPPSKYNTVYSILSRRANQVGDIINMKGDWALAEWYPNHRPKAKTRNGGESDDAAESAESTEPADDEKATA